MLLGKNHRDYKKHAKIFEQSLARSDWILRPRNADYKIKIKQHERRIRREQLPPLYVAQICDDETGNDDGEKEDLIDRASGRVVGQAVAVPRSDSSYPISQRSRSHHQQEKRRYPEGPTQPGASLGIAVQQERDEDQADDKSGESHELCRKLTASPVYCGSRKSRCCSSRVKSRWISVV